MILTSTHTADLGGLVKPVTREHLHSTETLEGRHQKLTSKSSCVGQSSIPFAQEGSL